MVETVSQTSQSAETNPAANVESGSNDVDTIRSQNYKGTKHKVKCDGKEFEVDYDDLIRDYQNAKSSDSRYKQASAIRKEIDNVINSVKNGDYNALIKLIGKDAYKKAAEEFLLKDLEYNQLPDHEKKLLEMEEEIKSYKEREKLQKEKEMQTRYEQLQRRAYQEIDQDISEAIKQSGLKPTPVTISRMAELMLANLESRGKRMDAATALKLTQKQLDNDLDKFLESVDVDKLRKKLPKKVLDALRKADVDEVLSQTPARNPKRGEPSEVTKRRVKDRRMSTDDWFRKMNDRFGR